MKNIKTICIMQELVNIQRCADEVVITSEVGKVTDLKINISMEKAWN